MSRATGRAGKRWDAAAGRWRWTASGTFAPAPSAPQKRAAASTGAKPSGRAGKRWDASAGRWRWTADGSFAPKPGTIPRGGKAAPASTRKTTRKGKRKSSKRAPGDIAALAIAVFRSRSRANLLDVLSEVAAAISGVTGGLRRDASDWRTRLEYSPPWGTGDLALALGEVDWDALDFRGALVHLGAITVEGVFLPITFAFGDPRDLGTMAVAELLKDVASYRSRTDAGTNEQELDDQVDDDERERKRVVIIGKPRKRKRKKVR
jgi:hypothetical protein